jgi:hypothetical protein
VFAAVPLLLDLTRCWLSRRQIDALQEIHQARGPMLLRVAFAVRDLWYGSQSSGSFVALNMRLFEPLCF